MHLVDSVKGNDDMFHDSVRMVEAVRIGNLDVGVVFVAVLVRLLLRCDSGDGFHSGVASTFWFVRPARYWLSLARVGVVAVVPLSLLQS
jgi:hypothetical protein